jgi:hypothetical protein
MKRGRTGPPDENANGILHDSAGRRRTFRPPPACPPTYQLMTRSMTAAIFSGSQGSWPMESTPWEVIIL